MRQAITGPDTHSGHSSRHIQHICTLSSMCAVHALSTTGSSFGIPSRRQTLRSGRQIVALTHSVLSEKCHKHWRFTVSEHPVKSSTMLQQRGCECRWAREREHAYTPALPSQSGYSTHKGGSLACSRGGKCLQKEAVSPLHCPWRRPQGGSDPLR